MKNTTILTLTSLAIASAVVIGSCKTEATTPKATYTADAKVIIDKSCAYSGCHSGGTTAGLYVPAGSKDYTNLDSLKLVLNNGKFDDRVLVKKNMPDVRYVPAGHPTVLTQAELDILTSWKGGAYAK